MNRGAALGAGMRDRVDLPAESMDAYVVSNEIESSSKSRVPTADQALRIVQIFVMLAAAVAKNELWVYVLVGIGVCLVTAKGVWDFSAKRIRAQWHGRLLAASLLRAVPLIKEVDDLLDYQHRESMENVFALLAALAGRDAIGIRAQECQALAMVASNFCGFAQNWEKKGINWRDADRNHLFLVVFTHVAHATMASIGRIQAEGSASRCPHYAAARDRFTTALQDIDRLLPRDVTRVTQIPMTWVRDPLPHPSRIT